MIISLNTGFLGAFPMAGSLPCLMTSSILCVVQRTRELNCQCHHLSPNLNTEVVPRTLKLRGSGAWSAVVGSIISPCPFLFCFLLSLSSFLLSHSFSFSSSSTSNSTFGFSNVTSAHSACWQMERSASSSDGRMRSPRLREVKRHTYRHPAGKIFGQNLSSGHVDSSSFFSCSSTLVCTEGQRGILPLLW